MYCHSGHISYQQQDNGNMYAVLTLLRGQSSTVSSASEGNLKGASSEERELSGQHLAVDLPNLKTSTAYSGDWQFLFDTGTNEVRTGHTHSSPKVNCQQRKDHSPTLSNCQRGTWTKTQERRKKKNHLNKLQNQRIQNPIKSKDWMYHNHQQRRGKTRETTLRFEHFLDLMRLKK